MLLMNSALYDALLEAGASEEKARKAAESVAEYETFWVCPTFYTWCFCEGCAARSATRASCTPRWKTRPAC